MEERRNFSAPALKSVSLEKWVFVRAGVLVLTVFPDVNFPVIDLLDHIILGELVDDSTLLGLHLHLGLHGFRGQDEDDISRGQACWSCLPMRSGSPFPKAPITWSSNRRLRLPERCAVLRVTHCSLSFVTVPVAVSEADKNPAE
jgi:hypothetical protein